MTRTPSELLRELRRIREELDHHLTWNPLPDVDRRNMTSAANAVELAEDCLRGHSQFINRQVIREG